MKTAFVAMTATKGPTWKGQTVTAEETSKATKKMVAGRTRIVFDRPLYAPCLFKLDLKPAPWLPTMATDGKVLMFNPQFTLGLPVEHLMFSILHEVMHCIFRHPARRGNRDPEIWNIAGDISINNILIFEEQLPHPSWVLKDQKYMGWSTEQIYDDLMKNAVLVKMKFKIQCPCVQKDPTASNGGQGDANDENGDQNAQGSSQGGDLMPRDPRGWTDVEWSKEKDEDWKAAVISAQQAAKMRGTVPGWMNSLVDEIVEPPVPIEKILQFIVGTQQSDDSTWRNPNRRFCSRGLYLPTTVRDRKSGVIVIDTSGSVDDETAKFFLGIALRAMRSKGINELRVMQVDTRIVDDVKVKNVAELKLHIKKTGLRGRGGTYFEPAFEKLAKEGGWDVSFLVYLTDLEGSFPTKHPRFPTFWISTTNKAAPFGRTYFWDQKGNKVVPVNKNAVPMTN